MKAARFVLRSAGSLSSASLVPREVDLFSRYSPSPLSMKQLLDFGEWSSGVSKRRWEPPPSPFSLAWVLGFAGLGAKTIGLALAWLLDANAPDLFRNLPLLPSLFQTPVVVHLYSLVDLSD